MQAMIAPATTEPYAALHGGAYVGPVIASSPDPLANYQWNFNTLREPLAYQIITDAPVASSAIPASAVHDLLPNGTGTIVGAANLTFRFAYESASWIEIDAVGLHDGDGSTMHGSISENRLQAPLESHTLTRVSNHTWRLVLNKELYEGVRYAFLNIAAPPTTPWRLAAVRRVSQVLPANYAGRFHASDPTLERLWWVGAYTTRAAFVSARDKATNQTDAYLGSILMNRGDRIAFLGDAHVAQATALAAFSAPTHQLLRASLNHTSTGSGAGIEPYLLMWVHSVSDYFDVTSDADTVRQLLPALERRLMRCRDVIYPRAVMEKASLRWSRDDDRMGFGFEAPDVPRAQCAYRMLAIDAYRRQARMLTSLGNASGAAAWAAVAKTAVEELRAGGAGGGGGGAWSSSPWWKVCGMHGAADAINAGFVNRTELEQIRHEWLSDPLQLSSLSPFESYFLLKALGTAGDDDAALFLLHRQWGGMLATNATTLWERYDPAYSDAGAVQLADDPPVNSMNDRTSMCHPWSSGATPFLSKYALGLTPATPGFALVDAAPRLLGLRRHGPHRLQWIAGAVPTPRGGEALLAATLEEQKGREGGAMAVSLPAGSALRTLSVPILDGLEAVHVARIAQSSRSDSSSDPLASLRAHVDGVARAAVAAAHDCSGLLLDQGLPILAQWSNASGGVLEEEAEEASATTSATTTTTAVASVARVGRASGHCCAFGWEVPTTDPRTPELPHGHSPPSSARVAGGVGGAGFKGNLRLTVGMDAGRAPRGPVNVSLYILDFKRWGTRSVIKVMDRDSSQAIAPAVLAEDDGNGTYYTFALPSARSLLIRMHQVHSPHGDRQGLHTPNFANLMRQGIELDRHYAYRFCSPSRSSLMSGRLPMHVNQWNHDGATIGGGVHANFSLLSDKLKRAGYKCHQLGKWHCGQSSPDLVPAARGFDTSLGYLNGAEDHWTQHRPACEIPSFVDLYATSAPAFGRNGTYGAQIYHNEAMSLLSKHDPSTPLFIYFAFQINHAPLQVPEPYKNFYPCSNSTCKKRSTYQAMTVMADEVAGNVTKALVAKGMWQKLLIIMSADNGGPSGTDADSANNYPLRGGKYSDFEGGVRVAAFLSGGFIPPSMRGTKLADYIHLCDWYATLSKLAGVDPKDDAYNSKGKKLPPIDSLDVWPYLSGAASASPRTEVPLTIGPHQPGCGGGLIVGRHKLLLGKQSPAIFPGRLYPNGTKPAPIEITCGERGCLYDVFADPTEYHDLAKQHDPTTEALLANLTARFNALALTAYQTPWAKQGMNCSAPRVRKMLAGGFWAPYTDEHAPDGWPLSDDGEEAVPLCPGDGSTW